MAVRHFDSSKVSELKQEVKQITSSKEETVFIHIVVWGKLAESLRNYLFKGSPVLVDGRLKLDNWETKDGKKRSRLKILAQRIQFLSSNKKHPPEMLDEDDNFEETMP